MSKALTRLIFILLAFSLFSWQYAQAQCARGNTRSTTYLERDKDKRCEGIKPIDVSGSLELISLSLGRITTLSKSLKLQVPNHNNQTPKVLVRSLSKNYQLDPISLTPKGSNYQFNWSNYVLDQENIDPKSLRATAFINSGRFIYLPVIFSPNAQKYDIILHSDHRAKISEFTILQNNQTIYTTSRPNFQPKGQISFTWNGRTPDGKPAPAGLYELRVAAQLEQDDAPPETAPINITFAHNPQWLK